MATLSLFAKLGLDKTGFDAGMKGASKQVEKFGRDIKSTIAGAFTFAAVRQYIGGMVEAANRIKDFSEQSGFTTDEVQKLDDALKSSGLSFDTFNSALNRMPLAKRAELMEKMSQVMAGMKVDWKDVADIFDLLGTKAGKFEVLFKNLSEQGPIKLFRPEDLEAIDRMDESLRRMKTELQAATAKPLAEALDAFRGVMRWAQDEGNWSGKVMRPTRKGLLQHVREAMGESVEAGEKSKAGRQIDWATAMEHMLMSGQGPGQAPGPGLFDILNKTIEFASHTAKFLPNRTRTIDSDPFQRIGAVTGASARANTENLLRDVKSEIANMRRELQSKGILVRGTD